MFYACLHAQMTINWVKLKDAADFPSQYYYGWQHMSPALYDSTNNVYYYALVEESNYHTKSIWKYDLNSNEFTTYPISNYVAGDVGAIAYDSINGRLIMMDARSQSTYYVSLTGGTINALGPGINSYQMFERNSFLNPLTNNPVIMNGYGYYAVRNVVCEYDIASGTWITRFPDSTNQPWRREMAFITANSDRTKIYMYGGVSKQSGSQSGPPDPGYIPVIDHWNWGRELWQLDLTNWQWTPLLGPNDTSIPCEGAICYLPDREAFILIGGYIYAQTSGALSTYIGGAYYFNPATSTGFSQISETGDLPAIRPDFTNYNGDFRSFALWDVQNNRIVLFRSDGIWAGSIIENQTPVFTEVTNNLTNLREGPADWGDFDNDGDLDLVISGADNSNVCRTIIYRNDGNGVFTDINAGIIGVRFGSVSWGDYNNDGYLDIALIGFTGSQSIAKIYKNNGDNTFTDINANLFGCHYSSTEWGDYDNDGDLDLALSGGYQETNLTKLYRNDGNDTFVEVPAGLQSGYGSCIAWGDYDNDRDLDMLFHTVPVSYSYATKVYRNDGNGIFTDINADLMAVDGPCEWGDLNNDGFLDIIISGHTNTNPYVTRIYRNNGDGTFTLVNSSLIGTYWGTLALGDYDNDGDLDIVHAGRYNTTPTTKFYRNDGDFVFTDMGVNIPGILYANITCADYDDDGDLDLLVRGNDGTQQITKLFRNDTINVNTRPDMPANLRTSILDDFTVFEWDAPDDDHTPSSGLSYNIRIGTTPEGCQIMSPLSNPDGTRQIPHIGIANGCSWKIKTSVLDDFDNYYWAVQAVDGAYLGSEFAPATLQYDFSASVLEGDVPLTTAFSILPIPFEAESVSWDFENDGIIDSNELSPTHTYTLPGLYSVKLTIQNEAQTDTLLKNDYISVTIPSYPRIVVSPDTLRFGNVAINDTVSKQMDIHNWGGENLEIYSITPASSRYSVSLPAGMTYPLIIPSLGSVEITVNFNPLAVQAYNANLVFVSNDPDNGVLTNRLEGNGYILSADFGADLMSGDIPLQVQFSDLSQGDIISWDWSFGDGDTSNEQHPLHVYTQKGFYTVSLTIHDVYSSRTLSRENYIHAIAHPVIASPDSAGVQFGIVYLGDVGTHELILQSTGTDSVFVTQLSYHQDGSGYYVEPASVPDYILPGTQAILQLCFAPTQARAYPDTLYVHNNSENMPVLKIKLSGTGEYVPPQAPQGVSIVIDGIDALITWEPVTQNIYNTPITVPYYFVYGSSLPDPDPTQQIFLGYSYGTSFRHLGVGLPGSNVQTPREFFYTVTAVVWFPPRNEPGFLDRLIGFSRKEVEQLLR